MQSNLNGLLPNDYKGSISITQSGHTCRSWSSTSYVATIGHDHNYCRSPDNDLFGAWCYTTNQNMKWDYCAFPTSLSGNSHI